MGPRVEAPRVGRCCWWSCNAATAARLVPGPLGGGFLSKSKKPAINSALGTLEILPSP